MKKILPVFVVLLVLVGGGSFYGGMKYSDSKRVSRFSADMAGGGNFRAGNIMGGGAPRSTGMAGGNARGVGFATGEILSKDDSSLTIKLRDGGSQIIFFSTSTQIMKSSAGSMGDLIVGESITVNGSTNQDGSVTAQSIQLRPDIATSSIR
ncbi:MAG: hypothetical protein A2534_00285 [Candidatus Magasanikbacteria bacterium RIFOXYD2_FULL_39_9]|uniref:DUF5666 domain-containing protein n=1 Tax=Candidatus Magasanikbacteria bacterium RIFOXYD1_FULL_40_23 TaxID=1798705 RepID=A0A1F6P9A9_9BACT|nr:MAG: hypothetical protein A2534_00285 [Candidatus Magasanikbacteria bacterium RIFOXYD2_FULL_39_9]OGH92767.1 MAG: hypothetical protein A2563_03810 [Candidatus Magasanikbacteria bacterium RIFOXYD1_FULL_40_23]